MKIMITVNSSFNIVNFRSRLVQALLNDGHELVALAPRDDRSPRLAEMGVRLIPLKMNSFGTSPLEETALLVRMGAAMRRERPAAILGFTIKNNLYGGFCARGLGIPFIPNVTGLGLAFAGRVWWEPIVRGLYRAAFAKAPVVFFQNSEDMALFLAARLARPDQAVLLPGSGVDLEHFTPQPWRGDAGEIRFLLIARMLWKKGIGDFVEAARLVKRKYPHAVFQLLGPIDEQNPGKVSEARLKEWAAEGVAEYLGSTEEVGPFIAQADCIVLPSFYREGTPRSLLEAAACARPVITTDMPGCRDTVDHGKSGYLCPAQDPAALAGRMIEMIEAGRDGRARLGRAAREKVEREFDERIVIAAYRRAVRAVETGGHGKEIAIAPARRASGQPQ